MNKFKLGFGPMSKEIIDILALHAETNNYPLMIIASRNQVDYNSGYVATTQALIEQLAGRARNNLLVCRDHCGPYFADSDRGLTVDEAIKQCKNTISKDINLGFDLIHIDVSRIPERQLDYAEDLIEYAINLKYDINLEFGSEDNTGVDIESSIGRTDTQLNFLQKYRDNVKFFVTQTGSLTLDNQAGLFDLESNKSIAQQIHSAGFLFKEHNADYFTAEDLTVRSQAGIDSLNIAPQLGRIQTDLLKEFAPDLLWTKFSNLVYSKNYWQRWVPRGVTEEATAVSVSGHYCFNSDEYVKIIQDIDYDLFKQKLKVQIDDLIDHYKTFDQSPDTLFQLRLKRRLQELRERDPFIYR